jgi:hypothetical protein
MSLLVATSALAPIVNRAVKPFQRVARMVEIHFLIVIYFRTFEMEEQLEEVASKLGIADFQGLSDRLRGRGGAPVEAKKQKGKKKRKRGKGGNSMV